MPTPLALLRRFLNSGDGGRALLPGPRSAASLSDLCKDLVSQRGEASGTAIARQIAERYAALTARAKLEFLESLLETNWLADPKEILDLATAYHANPTAEGLAKLFRVVEPRRQELFRRINMGPAGTKTLLDMRRDLLALLPDHPRLEPINADLIHLLSSWFNRGFLQLRKIDWSMPAAILEKLIRYEAVHEVQGWPDLRRRLQRDRRCFAFFHPTLPEEPLIFVQVALTRGMPAAIEPLIALDSTQTDPSSVDTATFYSISNCLAGLRNISFGAFLLKQVIVELENENRRLKNFVTLSPVPGFRKWLTEQKSILAGLNPATATKQQRQELIRWCARYLTAVLPSGRAVDPVAHFHLSNGASIERINWLADPSSKGIDQSFGLMVNYSYKPYRIERNHEQYVRQARCAVSGDVRALLQEKKAALSQSGTPSRNGNG